MQSTLPLAAAFGTILAFSAAAPPPAYAQVRTTISVGQALLIPGGVLTPGRYRIERYDTDNVLIESVDDQHLERGFIRTVQPIRRDSAGPTFSIRRAHRGALAELATWFPGGGTVGYAFGPQPVQDAQEAALLETRLRAAETTVAEAQQQLKAATANLDAIRTERERSR